EDGKAQYEVKVAAPDGRKLEIDVSPEGALLQTEEPVAVNTVPQAVRVAFAAKFPGKTATRAEKQTSADGTVTFELAFADGAKRHLRPRRWRRRRRCARRRPSAPAPSCTAWTSPTRRARSTGRW